MGLHSDPVHEHHLIFVGEGGGALECRACGEEEEEEIPGQIYYWCNLCESHFHEKCAKLPLQIKHFFHPCPIFLHSLSDSITCNSCFGYRWNAFSYRCERCDFDMCVDCATSLGSGDGDGDGDGEQIQLHCCHRHPLRPLPLESESLLSCQVCNMPCSLGGVGLGRPTWGCEPCNFHLHESCLHILPETFPKKKPRSKYAYWVLKTSQYNECIDCNQEIPSDLVYRRVNWTMNEYLCISCCLVRKLIAESSSSKVINHFFHPCLDLDLTFAPYSTCNACFLNHHYFFYRCKSCSFFLCFDCAQLPQLASPENEANLLVQHFCHWHPLKFFEGTQDTIPICSSCERICSQPFYSCNDHHCQFYIHKSCMDSLPHKTNHRLLRQTIFLLTIPTFECTTCKRQCSGLTFRCYEPNYTFCVKCVLWPENLLGDDGTFTCARHWHQLSLCETKEDEQEAFCFLCKECCIGQSYKCIECAFFFHKSCAELPTQLDHPIHPQHTLTLTNRSSSDPDAPMACELCLASLTENFHPYDWFYFCHQCDLQLDIQCASCLPSLEYKEHPHLLYVVVNMHGERNCRACSKSCQGSTMLRCADQECDFSLHLHCGPLPRTIKHACHVHPLILQDYYVEDNISDEFACHVCEEKRDPRRRVYYCSQACFMICDVQCVSSEVVPLLRGERGEVELITPFPQVACRVISNKSIIAEMMLVSSSERDGGEVGVQETKYVFSITELAGSSFNYVGFEEDETFGLEMLEEEADKPDDKLRTENEKEEETREETDVQIHKAETSSSVSEESSEAHSSLYEEVQRYSFSWKALSSFKNSLYFPSFDDLDEGFLEQYDGSIMTGDYALPEILGPIYQEFFGMYDIFDDKWEISYADKRCLICAMYGVLHQMRMTKVVDVKKHTIQQWLGWIRYVEEKGGFNVGFVAENIKRVWRAHYYIKSKKIVDKKSSQLRERIEKETRTLDELRIKVAEAEATLDELQLQENEHETYRVVGSRGPMKKERKDALEIKWRTCYDSLITYPGNAPASRM